MYIWLMMLMRYSWFLLFEKFFVLLALLRGFQGLCFYFLGLPKQILVEAATKWLICEVPSRNSKTRLSVFFRMVWFSVSFQTRPFLQIFAPQVPGAVQTSRSSLRSYKH